MLYRPKSDHHSTADKVLYVQIPRSPYKRYLYLLIKFFHMEGYRIYLPDNLKLLADLHKNKYAKLLIYEKIINIGHPPEGLPVLHLDDQLITADYFAYMKNPGLLSDRYFIPFTQHPLMYHHGYWDRPIKEVNRKKSIFMAGNFDPAYKEIESEGVFRGLHSRLTIKQHLQRGRNFHSIKNADQLEAYLSGEKDDGIVLINTAHYEIPMEKFRPTLARFDFFLSLPGVHMPFCHNFVEAMSVGAIPFIQESYARLVVPALVDGETCRTFTDLTDFDQKAEEVLAMDADKIAVMRSNVLDYYNAHLTPASQVRRIEQMDFTRLHLQAEAYSVEIERRRDFAE